MTNEDIVREACRVVWTEGDVSRISEFYAEDFTTDYPITKWGTGLEGIKRLAEAQRRLWAADRHAVLPLVTGDLTDQSVPTREELQHLAIDGVDHRAEHRQRA